MPALQSRTDRADRTAGAAQPRGTSFVTSLAAGAALLAALAACSMDSLTNAKGPSNLVTQESGESQSGAVAIYQGALTQFSQAFAGSSNSTLSSGILLDNLYTNYTVADGSFSDEFAGGSAYSGRRVSAMTEDDGSGPYLILSKARLSMDRALVALGKYTTVLPPSYRGEMHALKGYISVLFAELYCSGVPFTYVANDGTLVFGTPRSSAQMYQDAIAQFDSAIAIATDSVRIQQLATVGKARALLDLAEYDSAAAAVASLPAAFVSNVTFSSTYGVLNVWDAMAKSKISNPYFSAQVYMADTKGTNGLNYLTAADPRVPSLASTSIYNPNTGYFGSVYIPAKLATADAPIPLASGIEAQLIQAEAALKRGDASWLTTLNALRTTCASSGPCATPAPAGTGGVAGLPPLADPAASPLPSGKTATDVRVDLLFRERAFWLFATGHRTGDLRRLIRQYGRVDNTVFPTGTDVYGYGLNIYGTYVNLEPPKNERNNPNYHGCLNRDA